MSDRKLLDPTAYMQIEFPVLMLSSDLAPALPERNFCIVRECLYKETVVAQLKFYPDIWLEEEMRATRIFFINYTRHFSLDLYPGHGEYKSGGVSNTL